MAYDARLSELAIFDIESIATYVALHWSENVKMNFLVDVSEKLILLETLPLFTESHYLDPLFVDLWSTNIY